MNCEYCKSDNVKINNNSNEIVCLDCCCVQPEKIIYYDNRDDNRDIIDDERKLFTNKLNNKLNYLLKNEFRFAKTYNNSDKLIYYKKSVTNQLKILDFTNNTKMLIYFTFISNLKLIKRQNDRNILLCACIYVIQKNLLTFSILKHFRIIKSTRKKIYEFVRMIQK